MNYELLLLPYMNLEEDFRACEKITWNSSYQLMEQWCNSIEAKYHVFLD